MQTTLIEEKKARRQYKGINRIKGLKTFLMQNTGYCSCEEFLYLNDYYPSQKVLDSAGEISPKGIVVNKCLNDFRRINKYLESVNADLDEGEYFITCLITKDQRKRRIFENRSVILGSILYFLDFLFHRVIPKISVTKRLYFKLTKGKKRALTLTEGLGRLACCGFDIVDYKQVGNKTYVITQKSKKPAYDFNPTYGPLITLDRYGYKGDVMKVYKFRTMSPYSEYLQELVYIKNGLSDGGDNFKNDFRITRWGKILRKYWLDELPMFINYFKGDLKLIGVRPLSKQFYNLYPDRLKNLREQSKPGLLPPFYADMPKTMDEKVESEIKYLESYLKNPIKTDLIYGYKILKNIFFKNARSK